MFFREPNMALLRKPSFGTFSFKSEQSWNVEVADSFARETDLKLIQFFF